MTQLPTPEQARIAEHRTYRPEFEGDACGVGLIAATDGQPSRRAVSVTIAGARRPARGVNGSRRRRAHARLAHERATAAIGRIALLLLGVGAAVPAWTTTVVARPPGIVPAPTAKAVDQATLALARQIVATVHTDQILDRMMIQFAPVFGTTIVNSLLANPLTSAEIRQIFDNGTGGRPKIEAIFDQEFMAAVRRSYPAIEESAALEYASRFSPDELRAILAFYGSGVGAKALAMMPEIQAAMSAKGRELGAVAGKEATQRGVERIQQEMTGTPKEPKS